MTHRKNTILLTIRDLAMDFVYYERKEDEDLPCGEIEAAIDAGEITLDEIVDGFRTALTKHLGPCHEQA